LAVAGVLLGSVSVRGPAVPELEPPADEAMNSDEDDEGSDVEDEGGGAEELAADAVPLVEEAPTDVVDAVDAVDAADVAWLVPDAALVVPAAEELLVGVPSGTGTHAPSSHTSRPEHCAGELHAGRHCPSRLTVSCGQRAQAAHHAVTVSNKTPNAPRTMTPSLERARPCCAEYLRRRFLDTLGPQPHHHAPRSDGALPVSTGIKERLATLLQWVALGALVGLMCGASSALFLWLLDVVTAYRIAHDAIILALPLAGLGVGWFYQRHGASIKAGNNLVIDTIHDGGPEIPLRMAPMVLLGTVLTHLFGGSAGREGTAVQMGASLADALAHRLKVGGHLRRQMLAAGVAGGFGSVFGTPLAGTVFGLEFVVLGALEYDALVPALVAAVVGDLVTRGLGIVHTAYPQLPNLDVTPLLLGKWALFAAAVALCATVFIELTHGLKKQLEKRVPQQPVRMLLGGALVVLMWKVAGTQDYLGLGVPTLVRAFSDVDLPAHAFAAKLVFTSVTLGCGFLGGEVTPLFFIGAALGNALAPVLDLPLGMAAGVGMAALFGVAANAPLALSIMAAELLGGAVFPHAMVVCVLGYVLTGHRGIYPAQRLFRAKGSVHGQQQAVALRDVGRTEPPSGGG
jgi:H+/Cl- antiporter ClcA